MVRGGLIKLARGRRSSGLQSAAAAVPEGREEAEEDETEEDEAEF